MSRLLWGFGLMAAVTGVTIAMLDQPQTLCAQAKDAANSGSYTGNSGCYNCHFAPQPKAPKGLIVQRESDRGSS